VAKKRIIVSVSNDLSNDQRVHRVCSSLQSAGNDVVLLGRKLKKSPDISPRTYKTKRFRLLFNKGMLFYACLNLRLFCILLFSKADIFLSNDLDTLLANTLAAKIKRKKLVYDSHELFTEVPELEGKNLKKKLWLAVEKFCIRKADMAYTVCKSIADYYNNLYGIKMQVLRNLPVNRPFPDDFNTRENIILYQGALNKERGIDLMIEAMSLIEGWKLIIAGKGDLENELKELCRQLKLKDKVVFTGNLDFDSLHRLTKTAKLGLSLEQGNSLNYKFALPNKIFDYIQAGVPVLCSGLPEMKRIIDEFGVGETITGCNKESLSDRIISITSNPDLIYSYHKNCNSASKILNWKNEKEILLGIVN